MPSQEDNCNAKEKAMAPHPEVECISLCFVTEDELFDLELVSFINLQYQ